jgi:hypothetical protein
MLNNFFRISMPYGIIRNEKGEWTPFNREYMPLGYNDTQLKGNFFKEFGEMPIWTKYKALNEKTLLALSYPGTTISRDGEGKIIQIWFYDDASNPSASGKKADWEAYFERIKKLSKFEKE